MSKSGNVLADNPLEYMLAGNASAPQSPKQEPPKVVQLGAQETTRHQGAVDPQEQSPAIQRQGDDAQELAEVPVPATSREPSASAPARRAPSRKKGTRSKVAVREATAASRKNRIGTIQDPYTRSDGVKTRQASVTLPVDLLKRLNIYAIEAGIKTNQVYLDALEDYLGNRGR